MTIETYADSGDYTYPPGAERLLVQSTNWPADVNAQLAQQRADNVRLEEVIAWLENDWRSAQRAGLTENQGGRHRAEAGKGCGDRGEAEPRIERMKGFHGRKKH